MFLPVINLSLLQILTFHFIWPHCASGTQTYTQKQKRRKLDLNIIESVYLWIFFPILPLSPLTSGLNHFTKSCPTLCNPMDCSMPGFPLLHYLLEFAQTHVCWVHDAIQPSHPLSYLLLLPSCFPSIRVFSKESIICIRWPKHWSFSFRISPSNEYSGLIAFRLTGLIPAVQGILKSLLQHHGSKAAVLSASTYSLQLL